jgi:hypothetical protein
MEYDEDEKYMQYVGGRNQTKKTTWNKSADGRIRKANSLEHKDTPQTFITP